jgi:hypothetical protein
VPLSAGILRCRAHEMLPADRAVDVRYKSYRLVIWAFSFPIALRPADYLSLVLTHGVAQDGGGLGVGADV